MKRIVSLSMVIALFALMGCGSGGKQEAKDREIVASQQTHYGRTQPVPFYDHSIPRDIVVQIYDVVTREVRSTYTIIESVMGETKYHGPSIGYGIPADVSLTNPKAPAYSRAYNEGEIIEQAEPNGLFSSKNTDGTWVLFVDIDGSVTPIYTEHKVTTFPFTVKKDESGCWVRADKKKASLRVKIGAASPR